MHGIGGVLTNCWSGAPAALRGSDPVMTDAVDAMLGRPLQIPIVKDPYEATIRAIAHVRVSFKEGANRTAKFIALFGGTFPRPAEVVTVGAEKIQQALGVMAVQAQSMVLLSQAVVNRDIDLGALPNLTDDEVTAELGKIRGIGPWVSGMVLIFHLAREDVLVAGDTSLAGAVQQLWKLPKKPTEKEIEQRFDKWRPRRSAAALLIWNKAGLNPGLH